MNFAGIRMNLSSRKQGNCIAGNILVPNVDIGNVVILKGDRNEKNSEFRAKKSVYSGGKKIRKPGGVKEITRQHMLPM